MKRPTLKGSSESSGTDKDERVQEAVIDAIKNSDDKIIEIRPANKSKGRGKFSLMLLIGSVLAVGYWLQKSQEPTDKLQSAADETADRTKKMTKQAAETIQKGGETMAERVEEKSQKAGEQVEQTGENTAERVEEESQKAGEQVEQTGENTAEKTEQASEKVAEKADEGGSNSSGSSSTG